MSPQIRLAWFLPCLAVACGSTSVRNDSTLDGGKDHPSGGGGGSMGIDDGGPSAGGRSNPRRGAGGDAPGSGGFVDGDGGFFGSGGSPGSGGEFGVGGNPGAGGFLGIGGDFFGVGGNPGSGGNVFGTGGRAVDPACCDAIPLCRAGYDQVSGPGECNKGDICYEATACCSKIWCKAHPDEDAGACAAEAPPGVRYVSANASVCDRRAWTCPSNAYQYWDTCGCGCSQDPGCPASVDCKLVPKDPLCTDSATCPYTNRAF